ncbi:MarR family transcriptional regulator [Agrococcus sp. ARC_14]|uniref:MarR family winged helix-turn-helix transcriptional regulator n=1 Tax=Agrococcus sp. ARC_14 TaxID=2919927 RepID=UPI001F05BDBC|nr:MarR family transcriptional regulator [Agrococcus sp. ARC_14]MCH1882935.1 MarR family transcriptional regulator [Agrococcus sp. ARC_14]
MAIESSPAALPPAQLEIWAALATLLERLPSALDAQLQRDSGLTHFEHGLLYALDTAPDRSLRMSVLADFASATLSRLSRAVTRLEAKGWVRREPDPGDGRITLASLTEEGHRAVARAAPAHHALVQQLVFDTLSDAQARQLGVISRRIAEAVDAAPTWRPPSSDDSAGGSSARRRPKPGAER